MKIFLIRHGETSWNKAQRCQGLTDIELNEMGLKQAHALAQSLKEDGFKAIYSSPLKRAIETARLIADCHGLEVRVEPGLKEMNQGELEGLTYLQLLNDHREFLQEWIENPDAVKMPQGESLAELQERAWEVINRLSCLHHTQDSVVAVSHNFTIRVILCKAINLPLKHFRKLAQDVAAKNIIEYGERGWLLSTLNDTCHLNFVQ